MPGGESTTMTLGIEREGLAEPLRALDIPIFGTCAGLIMLDREHLGVMDIVASRNAFGRQVRSFEADLDFPGMDGGPVRAVFIRAPWISEAGGGGTIPAQGGGEAGEGVTILAEVDGHPVAAEQGDVLVVSFHPELTGETRLHARFLARVQERTERVTGAGSGSGAGT